MQIQISNLLRLRKELKALTNKYLIQFVYLGSREITTGINQFVYEDGQVFEEENETPKMESDVYLEKLDELLKIHNIVENCLDTFNFSHQIPALVRQRKQLQEYIVVLESLTSTSKPRTQKKLVDAPGENGCRVEVTHRYTPFLSSASLRKNIKELKKKIRGIDSQIQFLNTESTELDLMEFDLETEEQVFDFCQDFNSVEEE